MADYLVTDTELANVANAIRTKGGISAALTWPSGYVSAVNAIPTGGGGSNYTLIGTAEFAVSTTSTGSSTVGTVQCNPSAWVGSAMIYVRIRDKAGARNGYFVGSDSWFINTQIPNGYSGSVYAGGRFTISRSTNGKYGISVNGATTGYGVYPYSIDSAGAVTIQRRYSSSSSLTIDGTYSVEVYRLSWPDGVTPFD